MVWEQKVQVTEAARETLIATSTRMATAAAAHDKGRDYERDSMTTRGGSGWDVVSGNPKEGLLEFICMVLMVFATVPIYTITLLAHSIMYGQYRESQCTQLNGISFLHVIAVCDVV